MGAEAGLRQRIRTAIRAKNPDVLIVGQPANGMTGRGRSDLYVIVAGRYVGLEVKTATGKPTQLQIANIVAVRAAGGYAWLVRTPHAACIAVDYARKGAIMASDEFDLDALLAGFSPEQLTAAPEPTPAPVTETAPSPQLCPKKDRMGDPCVLRPGHEGRHVGVNTLDATSLPETATEEHLASKSLIDNGVAAGDGVMLTDEDYAGLPSSPTMALSRAIDALGLAVAEMADELRAWRQYKENPLRVVLVEPAEEEDQLPPELEDLPDFPEVTSPPPAPTKPVRRRKQQ